jgi:hypothetical protein
VDPVPDPLLLGTSDSSGNRTRISVSVAGNSGHETKEAVLRGAVVTVKQRRYCATESRKSTLKAKSVHRSVALWERGKRPGERSRINWPCRKFGQRRSCAREIILNIESWVHFEKRSLQYWLRKLRDAQSSFLIFSLFPCLKFIQTIQGAP